MRDLQDRVLFYGFVIKTQQIIEQKRAENLPDISFFVADIVGSYDWLYPFSIIYDRYYDPDRTEYLNWNTARTQAGRLYASCIPEIEKELQVKITTALVDRKGHRVNCYKVKGY